jgi:photosynthetic reaction center cytochrome c subunit
VRDLNRSFIAPLASIVPASRKGPLGDPLKITCSTCHQGAYKPLFGASMLKDYPGLAGPPQVKTAAAAAPR